MPLNREEIAADLIWRYVEHLRQSEEAGVNAALSAAELAQLVDTMSLAGDVTYALVPDEPCEVRRAAVLSRVEAHVAAARPAAAKTAERPARSRWAALTGGGPVPAWKFRVAFGSAVTIALAFLITIPVIQSRPHYTTVVKPIRVPVRAAEIDIQPVEEARAHDMLPRLVRNELEPKDERNLMWHMLICRGCFDDYVELKHQHPITQQPITQSPNANLAAYHQ